MPIRLLDRIVRSLLPAVIATTGVGQLHGQERVVIPHRSVSIHGPAGLMPGVALINNQDSLVLLWNRLNSPPKSPIPFHVDFAKESVVALSIGADDGCARYSSILQVSASRDTIHVSYGAPRSGDMAFSCAWSVWPISMAIIPRTDLPVVARVLPNSAALPSSPAWWENRGPLELEGVAASEHEFYIITHANDPRTTAAQMVILADWGLDHTPPGPPGMPVVSPERVRDVPRALASLVRQGRRGEGSAWAYLLAGHAGTLATDSTIPLSALGHLVSTVTHLPEDRIMAEALVRNPKVLADSALAFKIMGRSWAFHDTCRIAQAALIKGWFPDTTSRGYREAAMWCDPKYKFP